MSETRIGVDVGGTFTDVVLVTDNGDLVTAKTPSTTDQSVGVMNGIEKACRTAGIDPTDIDEFIHAMTVSVNALLERDGACAALVTTDGFRDVLEIGRQSRPSLYDLDATKPDPLVPRRRRIELDERATPEGIERSVDSETIDSMCETLEDMNVESVAVSLLHAYAAPENEAAVADGIRDRLDVPVSVSHEVLSAFREYERTATTVADAYVRPAIDAYVSRLEERVADAGVPAPRIMQSNGGIADAATVRKRAVTTVLSGPAAGVVGAREVASSIATERGLDGAITFDMGGTSSDVSLIHDRAVERTTEATIADVPIGLPMVDIHTVGSGGGSIAWIDEGSALRVGPRSAGGDPGPACYGRGGTDPTVTDANLLLGYLGDGTALGGELTLDADAAAGAFESVAAESDLDDAFEAARGAYRVANATMTRVIRAVTVERGHDPRRFGLVAFGGAGPMHATALADSLDIGTVIVPLAGGVLSAYGLLGADETHDAVRTHRTPLEDADAAEIERVYDELEQSVHADVHTDGPVEIERTAHCRYAGQSFELAVPVDAADDPNDLADRFHARHADAYGYRMDEPVELVTLQVTASVERDSPVPAYDAGGAAEPTTRIADFNGEQLETTVRARRSLEPGESLLGPTIIEGSESTTVVRPGWEGVVRAGGTLVLTRGENQ